MVKTYEITWNVGAETFTDRVQASSQKEALLLARQNWLEDAEQLANFDAILCD